MESNSACNHNSSSNKIGRPRSGSPINLSITSMITNLIGRQEVLLPINHKNYNFQEEEPSYERKENLH